MSANFTPGFGTYRPLTPFRYWCQKVLPLTYDDSLSYYELLNKVVDYLNMTMEDVETLHDDVDAMLTAFNALQTYVNTYFDELDLTEEVQTVLDRMAENGSLDDLLRPLVGEQIGGVVAEQIDDAVADQIYATVASQINAVVVDELPGAIGTSVTDWLNEHVSTGDIVVDDTLSISGAAADAKVAGDKINHNSYNIEKTENDLYNVTDDELNNSALIKLAASSGIAGNGTGTTMTGYRRTSAIPIVSTIKLHINSLTGFTFTVWTYSGTSASTRIRTLTPKTADIPNYVTSSEYNDIIIRNEVGNENYFRIGYKKDDLTAFTDQQVSDIEKNQTFLKIGIKKYEDITPLISVGNSILDENDMLDGTTVSLTDTTNLTMYNTKHTDDAVYTTKIIDLGYEHERTFSVKHIYRIIGYHDNGTYADYVQTNQQYDEELLTLEPHRYIRVLANRNAKFSYNVTIADTIQPDSHRGVYTTDKLNLDNLVTKRAYLRSGYLGSESYRMGFCEYTKNGVLLLGGEMRYSNGADNNDISIAFTRSLDNGKTFEEPSILFEKNSDPNITYHTKSCGQFLVDSCTGRVFCFCLREDSNVNRLTTYTNRDGYDSSILYKYSDDDGKTWSNENSIDLRDGDMMMMTPSPGKGITLRDGTLVVPAWCLYSDGTMKSLLIYSTNQGTTWSKSQSLLPSGSNECCAVESTTIGRIIINARNEDIGYRQLYYTDDLGTTYVEMEGNEYSLKTPICSASMTKIVRNVSSGDVVYLYSSPTDFAFPAEHRGRAKTVVMCTRDFKNWKEVAMLSYGQTRGYTCIAVWNDYVNIVEEFANEVLTCDTIRCSEYDLGCGKLKIPPTVTGDTLERGQLVYNKTIGRLQFVDDSGTRHNIKFE